MLNLLDKRGNFQKELDDHLELRASVRRSNFRMRSLLNEQARKEARRLYAEIDEVLLSAEGTASRDEDA
jgi:anti-sigma-K factor RskA